ncbi:hypothetical protein QFZ63_003671 [Streptomyces sp. B3I7]|uniref:DUF5667 domain-containing protein n=1 Tax=Streptomyces sp. B3I7 TaxID=3042269 RepID=UPI002782DC53|nr:DUF5667 domain-containing protein [Streptomyces sp. B3I7]MDQ0811957.1 hypothetical protein [Streptomyces sp. B3I7]
MIANVSAHRRANAFAQALEELTDRGPAAEQPDLPDTAPTTEEGTGQQRLLALATGLGELPKPQLDPEVKVVHRARLVAAMEAMLSEGTVGGEATDPAVPEQRDARERGAHRAGPLGRLRPRTRLAKGLTAGGLGLGVAAASFGGVAAASTDALPGDSLYGLKRGIEDVRLDLADGDSDRGRVYLDQASTRLSEARRLMERDRSGPLDHESLSEVRRALDGMRHDASEGHRLLHEAYAHDPESLGPLRTLSAFSRSHGEAWSELSRRLPVQLGDVASEVSEVFAAINDEVTPLLPSAPPEDGFDDEQGSAPASPTGSARSDHPEPGTGRGSAPGGDGGGTAHKPEPSSSRDRDRDRDEGLLGGSAGGLLDPPRHGAVAGPSAGGSKHPTMEPDVTLPPLLPGLLPGLGIDNEGDRGDENNQNTENAE